MVQDRIEMVDRSTLYLTEKRNVGMFNYIIPKKVFIGTVKEYLATRTLVNGGAKNALRLILWRVRIKRNTMKKNSK